MNIRKSILAAERRIRDHVRETPVEDSPALGDPAGCRVYLKLENLQRTGSFKLRGATNKLRSLDDSDRSKGIAAASTGNHGAAVACAARDLSCRALIFVPENAVESKVEAIHTFGAEIVRSGDDSVAADLQTLVANLPENPGAFSPALYQAVVQFVLENGSLEEEEKARLEGALGERQPTKLNQTPGYPRDQGRQGF